MTVVRVKQFVVAVGCSTLVALGACDPQPSVNVAEGSTLRVDSTSNARSDSAARARADSVVRSQPGYVVDSILPIDEEIRRFQATLGDEPSGLRNGAASRGALVRSFVDAVERNDTTALGRLVVDRAEFGYLVYPASPNVAPPYKQSPQVVWLMRSAGSAKGANRLVARFGGQSLRYVGTRCPGAGERQGSNTVWNGCTVARLGDGGDTTHLAMFGSIIERGGRYKFLSLSNGL